MSWVIFQLVESVLNSFPLSVLIFLGLSCIIFQPKGIIFSSVHLSGWGFLCPPHMKKECHYFNTRTFMLFPTNQLVYEWNYDMAICFFLVIQFFTAIQSGGGLSGILGGPHRSAPPSQSGYPNLQGGHVTLFLIKSGLPGTEWHFHRKVEHLTEASQNPFSLGTLIPLSSAFR